MTAEAGFLETLRTHPDDDDTRLVYADWLEERDDPRAAYLRLVVEITELVRAEQPYEEPFARLVALVPDIDAAWRAVAGRCFDVVLLSFAGEKIITVIKWVRLITVRGLKEAKELVETAPSVIRANVLLEEAESLRRELSSLDPSGTCRAILRLRESAKSSGS